MKINKIIKDIENKFIEGLQRKTNWGRNEVKELFTNVVNGVILEELNKLQEKEK